MARKQAHPAGPPAAPQLRKRLDLHRYVPANIAFLAYKLSQGASKHYLSRFGVTTIDWRIIAYLAEEPGISGQRLCKMIGLDKAAVSRSLAFLEQEQLVRFHRGGDGRERLATLTARGGERYEQIVDVALERERRLLACLTAAERETLAALLDRVHANVSAVDEPLDGTPIALGRDERHAS